MVHYYLLQFISHLYIAFFEISDPNRITIQQSKFHNINDHEQQGDAIIFTGRPQAPFTCP